MMMQIHHLMHLSQKKLFQDEVLRVCIHSMETMWLMMAVQALGFTASTQNSTPESMDRAEEEPLASVASVEEDTLTTHKMRPLVEKATTTTISSRKRKLDINSSTIKSTLI